MPQDTRPNLEPFLDRLNRHSILTAEEQQAVLNLPCHAEQVRANEDFVRLGERVRHSSLVIAGVVGRFDQSGDGARQVTAMHIPGDMCDLHSVVRPVAVSALQAFSVATIGRVPHVDIRAAAARYPAVAEALWRDCVIDAAILSEWVVNVGRRDAKKRIAHLLCEIAVRLGAAENTSDVVFDLPVTQTQMADATALTAVHVNRTLQSLRAEGLVAWRARLVRLPRWKALTDVAEFDPTYLQLKSAPEHRLRIVQAS